MKTPGIRRIRPIRRRHATAASQASTPPPGTAVFDAAPVAERRPVARRTIREPCLHTDAAVRRQPWRIRAADARRLR
ncbi:hypothetical protein WG70_25520 [Burkholderia oklahomensis EO147]|nr:hypothetical protein WG70_25520 [Burkholderia oklahomensis EO147]AOI46459.1 hypothetical protein WI23_12095 [Burkholderia oklahomensis C6786]KUY56278.1 hypothetical protein WI23_20395 [Burkholderia oklahomensis C6786]KUY58559.1 hypothetical protein WG70_07570 [Burkholderia oklahomensis EO147]